MTEVKELLWLKRNKVKIIIIEEQLERSEKVQVITLVGTTNKVKCLICLKYTSSVHDKLNQ